jgi:hypothetical protein
VRAHHGAVEHHPLEIAVGGELVHQPLPDAFLLPAGEPLETLFHGPNSVGSIRHAAPARGIQSTASTNRRVGASCLT